MTVKKVARLTELPKVLDKTLRDRMTVKKVVKQTWLPVKLVKELSGRDLLNMPQTGNDDVIERVMLLTNLLMARFSLDRIEAMHKGSVAIADAVEEQARELGDYPALRGLLSQPEMKEARDVFELGTRVGKALPGLINAELSEKLQKQCLEISGMLDRAVKRIRVANAIDVIGWIPLVGIIIGMIRTKLISGTKMREIRELNSALSEMLSGLEPDIDFAAYDMPNSYRGLFYDYSRPALAAGNYMSELDKEMKYLKNRGYGIRKQLNLLAS